MPPAVAQLVAVSALASTAISIVLAAAGRRQLARALRAVPREAWAVLACITLAAAAVRLGAPQRSGMPLDGLPTMLRSRSLLLAHESEPCLPDVIDPAMDLSDALEAYPLACPGPREGGSPAGTPAVMAAAFSLLGVSPATARAASLLASVAAVPALFVLASAALGSPGAGLMASASLALLPLHVAHAGAGDGTFAAVLAPLLCLAALACALRSGSRTLEALAAALLALAVSLAPENIADAVPLLLLARAAPKRLSPCPGAWALAALLALPALVELPALLGAAAPSEEGTPLRFTLPARTLHLPMTLLSAALGLWLAGRRRSAPFLAWAALHLAWGWWRGPEPACVLSAYLAVLPLSGAGLAAAASFLFPEYAPEPPR